MNQQGMFAAPTKTRALCQFDLHDRGRIAKNPVTEGSNLLGDPIGESLQTCPDHFVIIATERIARDVGPLASIQCPPGGLDPLRIIRSVIGTHHHGPNGPRNQFGWTGTSQAVSLHIIH